MTEQQQRLREKLLKLLAEHPDARIVTDVGASMCSGWGDLADCNFSSESNAIELVFD